MKPIDCSLLIFGLTVSSVLDSACQQRDLDAVELWSGVEAIVSAARVAGFTAEPFDKFRVPGVTDTDDPDTTEDILLEAGFKRALSLVLRLRPGGLLWMAPVCSSWIFLNLKNTKRTQVRGPRFQGNLKFLPVQQGNRMAEMAAFLFLVAVSRGVHAVIENPAGSMMFRYLVFEQTCRLWKQLFWAIVPYCRYSTAPLGKRYGKKFKMMGSHAWVQQLAAKCQCPGRKHVKLVIEKIVNGKRIVTGKKKALRDSSAYPPRMGTDVIQKWMNNVSVSGGPEPKARWQDAAASSGGPKSKVRCPSSSARSGGPKSKVRGRSAAGDGKRTWATLELDESAATSSSSSRAPSQRRTRWQALELDDDPPDADASTGHSLHSAGAAKKWRTLDLDDGLTSGSTGSRSASSRSRALAYRSRAIGGKLCPWMRDERLGGRKLSLANRVCKNGNCSASPKRNTQHIEHCEKH